MVVVHSIRILTKVHKDIGSCQCYPYNNNNTLCRLSVSIGQVIGCEDRLRSDQYCVGWGVKLCSTSTLCRLSVIQILDAEIFCFNSLT